MKTTIECLQEARAGLVVEEKRVQDVIAKLDFMIEGFSDSPPPTVRINRAKPVRFGKSPINAAHGERIGVFANAVADVIKDFGPLSAMDIRRHLVRTGIWNRRSKRSLGAYICLSKRFKKAGDNKWALKD